VILDKSLADTAKDTKLAIHGSINTQTIIVNAEDIVSFLHGAGVSSYRVHDFTAPPKQELKCATPSASGNNSSTSAQGKLVAIQL
jgi:hypothetical protein